MTEAISSKALNSPLHEDQSVKESSLPPLLLLHEAVQSLIQQIQHDDSEIKREKEREKRELIESQS